MHSLTTYLFYLLAFLSLYVQVFLLVTYFERRHEIVIRKKPIKLKKYPGVTIIVPCYNEEDTIAQTVQSLLQLRYPSDKLDIILIDDGSTDNTWNILQSFSQKRSIRVFHQENSGKHVAINVGIEHTRTELVGGLDSDSYVHPEALKRIVSYFEDSKTMAVCPSIIVHEPKNYLQKAQKAEYDMSVFTKKMLAFAGGIHVTPGPFSIFRKKVFDDLGPYRKAHNTEDQEIALRMQVAGYKIEHCPDAYVYTKTPTTIPKLYRQRLRWIYGFIKNSYDYRHIWFRSQYGTVGLLTIPAGIISLWSLVFLLILVAINLYTYIYQHIVQYTSVGYINIVPTLDLYYINTQASLFLLFFIYGFVFFGFLLGRKMAHGTTRVRLSDIYFIIVYRLIAPFWILKALWNAFRGKESSWIFERQNTTHKKPSL